MIKDELKNEAEEYCANNCGDCYGCHKKYRKNKNCEKIKSMIKTYLAAAEPREKRIAELEATCNKWFEHLKNREEELLNELNNQNAKYNKQIAELETRCNELFLQTCEQAEKISELEQENADLKDEWQEQVQKATDEGYARTLQTMQLTKAKEIIKTFLAIVNNDVEYVQNPQDCKDLWKELCEKAEQFLSEVEK